MAIHSLLCSCLKNSMDKRSLEGYSPRGRKESDTTEHTHKDKIEIEKINNRIINGDLSEDVILVSKEHEGIRHGKCRGRPFQGVGTACVKT